MRILTVSLYFIFAIVILASIGVSLPYIFDNINNDENIIKNLNQNLVTYFIAILVSASLDYVLRLIDDNVSYKKPVILTVCIFNTAIFFMTAFILHGNSKPGVKEISGWTIIGVILAFIMWWIANFKNTSFDNNSPIGGDANRDLRNG